jgi:hypothetical protein
VKPADFLGSGWGGRKREYLKGKILALETYSNNKISHICKPIDASAILRRVSSL